MRRVTVDNRKRIWQSGSLKGLLCVELFTVSWYLVELQNSVGRLCQLWLLLSTVIAMPWTTHHGLGSSGFILNLLVLTWPMAKPVLTYLLPQPSYFSDPRQRRVRRYTTHHLDRYLVHNYGRYHLRFITLVKEIHEELIQLIACIYWAPYLAFWRCLKLICITSTILSNILPSVHGKVK